MGFRYWSFGNGVNRQTGGKPDKFRSGATFAQAPLTEVEEQRQRASQAEE
jgi:hypothetical protein